MKLIQEIKSFADLDIMGTAAPYLNRAEEFGYSDAVFAAMEKALNGEATAGQIEHWLSYKMNYIAVAGWDFIEFDSREDYEREKAVFVAGVNNSRKK